MFLSSTYFSVKFQPIDWRLATSLDKEWQRYLAETVPKVYKELSCWNHAENHLWWSSESSFVQHILKKLVLNSGYSRVAVCTTETCNFIKKNFIVDVFQKIFETFAIIFPNIPICVEKSNHIKDHITRSKWEKLFFFALSVPKYETSAGKKLKSRTLTLQALIPHNSQEHLNNLSAIADELFECVWPY